MHLTLDSPKYFFHQNAIIIVEAVKTSKYTWRPLINLNMPEMKMAHFV